MVSPVPSKPLCIGAYFNRKSKASREQVAGIFRFAGEHPDWELHLFARPDTPAEMRRMTRSFTPDGIITGHPAVVDAFNRRLGRHMPCVLIDYAVPRSAAFDALVLCDDHEIGERAAAMFLKRGYRSFAFAGITGESGDSEAVNSRNRENGFCRTLRNAGFGCAVYRERLEPNSLHYRDASGLGAWLEALPKPCALLAHSDLLAQSVLTVCRGLRIAVPDQVAVIGVDNEEVVCESASPKLSSIEPDFAGGGYLAANLLDRRLRGKSHGTRTLRATYGVLRTEERMSTQNVTGAHLRVAKALAIIRAEAARGIRAADIAARLGISTRLLEMTFRKTLGRSVREELLDFRLTQAKRLLKTTSKGVAEIAAASGFRTPSALKAIFRKKFGCSLRDCRRQG